MPAFMAMMRIILLESETLNCQLAISMRQMVVISALPAREGPFNRGVRVFAFRKMIDDDVPHFFRHENPFSILFHSIDESIVLVIGEYSTVQIMELIQQIDEND